MLGKMAVVNVILYTDFCLLCLLFVYLFILLVLTYDNCILKWLLTFFLGTKLVLYIKKRKEKKHLCLKEL